MSKTKKTGKYDDLILEIEDEDGDIIFYTWRKLKQKQYFENHRMSASFEANWDMIKDYPKLPWNWSWISANPNITWEIIRDNLGMPWDWRFMGANRNITSDIIKANPDKPWDWGFVSQNPNVDTVETIGLLWELLPVDEEILNRFRFYPTITFDY